MDVPTLAHMRWILDTIDAAVDEGRTVYIHCWGGIGRTGTVVGCYLVRQGMAGDQALQEITRRRGIGSPETESQRQMVLNWCEETA
jgi:protein-tyrosine phosphatase